jgi:DNA-binding NarL/FixJ family response regulator
MIRVLIADDHVLVRQGMVHILESTPDIVVAGEAGSGHEALRAVQRDSYDLLVLDIAMPEGSGLQVLDQLRMLQPQLPVLVLSMYPERQYAVRALRLGAAGYMTKDSPPEELIGAIRAIAAGGQYLTPPVEARLLTQLRGVEGEPHESLSDREYEVMLLLARGRSVSDIAEELSLATSTISTYRARVLRKLGLSNTPELVRYAVDRGLDE